MKTQTLRLWLTSQSQSMTLDPELVSSSQCQFTLDFHREAFGLCVWVLLSYLDKGTNFINTENHCYLLILIYSKMGVIIKSSLSIVVCIMMEQAKCLMVTRLFLYGLNSSLGLTGNSSSWLEGTHLHLRGEWEYGQGCSWRCRHILSSSGLSCSEPSFLQGVSWWILEIEASEMSSLKMSS